MYLFPSAPPSYAEVVTEEQRRNNLAPVSACDDFERALQGPLFAYIQEFRFLPPPLYSEVSIKPSSTKWAVTLLVNSIADFLKTQLGFDYHDKRKTNNFEQQIKSLIIRLSLFTKFDPEVGLVSYIIGEIKIMI